MKFKPIDCIDLDTDTPWYGIHVQKNGKWYNACEGVQPLFFLSEDERNAKLRELRKRESGKEKPVEFYPFPKHDNTFTFKTIPASVDQCWISDATVCSMGEAITTGDGAFRVPAWRCPQRGWLVGARPQDRAPITRPAEETFIRPI